MRARPPGGATTMWISLGLWLLATARSAVPSAALPGIDVFPGHTAGVDCYCVPNLVAVPGRLLAFAEARLLNCDDGGVKTVAVRASSDGGVSWTAPAADLVSNSTDTNLGGVVWDSKAQALFASYSTAGPCFACDWRKWGTNCSRGCRNVWVRKSTDKGASWGVPQNVSGAIFDSAVAGTPAAIGEFVNAGPTKGLQLADGTLVMVIVDLSAPKPGFPGGGILSIRSSDHGASWHGGQPMFVPGWSETSIALLHNGSLLANGRCGSANPACPRNGAIASRLFALSSDGGITWGRQWSDGSPGSLPRVGIPGAVCDGDTIALPPSAAGTAINTLLFSHPAGLRHMDDRPFNGTFVGSCFDYPRQVPGPKCKALKACPFAGDAPCRSNLTILASTDSGLTWQAWAQDFWAGFANAPWDPPGTDREPFPSRAGYSSLAFVPAAESASHVDEVAILFEATGEIGPLRLIRLRADGPHVSGRAQVLN